MARLIVGKREDEVRHEGVAGTRPCGASWNMGRVWGFNKSMGSGAVRLMFLSNSAT